MGYRQQLRRRRILKDYGKVEKGYGIIVSTIFVSVAFAIVVYLLYFR